MFVYGGLKGSFLHGCLQEEVKMLREASQLLHRQLESGPPACGDLPPVPGFGGDVDLPAVPGFGGTSDDLWDEVNVLTDRLAERDREVEVLVKGQDLSLSTPRTRTGNLLTLSTACSPSLSYQSI